jgi:hypothetical protein
VRVADRNVAFPRDEVRLGDIQTREW